MDRETKGAWIIHHGQKLKADAHGSAEFSALDSAAKAGTLFSQLGRSEESRLPKSKVEAYAKAIGLNPRLELQGILDLLKEEGLVDLASNEIAVVGATTRGALGAASSIFEELEPTSEELAALTLAELASEAPLSAKEAAEYVGDEHRMARHSTADFLKRAELIGFVDAEGVGDEKILFNGNLFRIAGPAKVAKVLDTLSEEERSRLLSFLEKLKARGCVTLNSCSRELGETLVSKLRAVGLLDVSFVDNEVGPTGFVTKPDAFHKFVSPLVDDAFDLAKALVAALSYGIQRSTQLRGKIWGVDLLLGKLIRGGSVGPAPAIGQDYKYLEQRGVVEVYPDGSAFSMRLVKPEIGQIALQVLTMGSALTAQVLDGLPPSPMAGYRGPEATRSAFRKTDRGRLRKTDRDVLHVLRTKGTAR